MSTRQLGHSDSERAERILISERAARASPVRAMPPCTGCGRTQISFPAPVSTILVILIPAAYSPASLSLQWRTMPLIVRPPHTITTLLPMRTGDGAMMPSPLRETSLICTSTGERAATQRVAVEDLDAIRISFLRSAPRLRSTMGPISQRVPLSFTRSAIVRLVPASKCSLYANARFLSTRINAHNRCI